MKASEWIDRVKAAREWPSDYRAAKELKLTHSTITNYRVRQSTLDENICVKVAAALGEKPEIILIDQLVERSRNDEAKAAFSKVLKRLGGVAAGALLAVGIGGAPAPAQAASNLYSSVTLYIM